jgi:hypothetical protein
MFSSGRENLHQVQQVMKGTRYAMSMWFTCNPERKFEQFLDGKVHTTFAASDEDGNQQTDKKEEL